MIIQFLYERSTDIEILLRTLVRYIKEVVTMT